MTFKRLAIRPLSRQSLSFSALNLVAILFVLLMVCGSSPVEAIDQWYVFDFSDNGGSVHSYSPFEEDEVVAGVASMYAPFGRMKFTKDPADVPFGMSYSPVRLNSTAIGTSSGIDFRNKGFIDSADVNALDGLAFAGIPTPTPTEIVKASVNLAAHEIGHLEGLQHFDSWGPIGTGLPSGGLATSFDPDYPGPAAASLSSSHVMSLTTASAGAGLGAIASDLSISPRSATKLAFNADGDVFSESVIADPSYAGHGAMPLAAPLPMKTIGVPNTALPSDPAFGKLIFADQIVVVGEIVDDGSTGATEADYYSFGASAGQFLQVQVLSDTIDDGPEVFDAKVAIFDAAAPGTPLYFGMAADNDQGIELEFTDPQILDLPIGGSGEYLVEVFGTPGETGDYELFVNLITIVDGCIIGDADCDGDVDISDDILTAFSNFTGPGSFGKTRAEGDVEGPTEATISPAGHDTDVDVTDILTMFGAFTGPLDEAGLGPSEAGDPSIPDLIYDPATGEVVFDLDGAPGLIGYSLKSAGGFLAGGHTPILGGVTTSLPTELAEAALSTPALPASIGFVFPLGMDLGDLTAFLTDNTVSTGLGAPLVPFDLVVLGPAVPEPATIAMALLGLFGLAFVGRRRRHSC